MVSFRLWITLCFTLFLPISISSDKSSCRFPVYYKVLGCTPQTRPGEECPSSFNCDHLKDQDPTKCYWKGKGYSEGEEVDEEDLPHCKVRGKCVEKELFFSWPDCEAVQSKENCLNARDQCCWYNFCGEEKPPTCSYQGHHLTFGSKGAFYQDRKAFFCLCDENFDNTTDPLLNPHCHLEDCSEIISNMNGFNQGCSFIMQKQDTCPLNTKCPVKNEKIDILKLPNVEEDPDLKCPFGSYELQLGEYFLAENRRLNCSCLLPPLLDCDYDPEPIGAEYLRSKSVTKGS